MKYSYCYILSSHKTKSLYVGITDDLKKEVELHNKGQKSSTRKDRPWDLIWYSGFISSQQAKEFGEFLKSEEGRMFLHKWFAPIAIESLRQQKPTSAIVCPVCGGAGKTPNETFLKYGTRITKNFATCLTCIGRGWIDSEKEIKAYENQ